MRRSEGEDEGLVGNAPSDGTRLSQQKAKAATRSASAPLLVAGNAAAGLTSAIPNTMDELLGYRVEQQERLECSPTGLQGSGATLRRPSGSGSKHRVCELRLVTDGVVALEGKDQSSQKEASSTQTVVPPAEVHKVRAASAKASVTGSRGPPNRRATSRSTAFLAPRGNSPLS